MSLLFSSYFFNQLNETIVTREGRVQKEVERFGYGWIVGERHLCSKLM